MRLRFGDVTFDGDRRLLHRGPDAVHLSPKAFQLLELLLRRRPIAVSKEEIHETLWPSTFVTESSLAALMNEVRRGLGESGRGAGAIRTVHGYGYAFDAPVRELSSAPRGLARHVLVWGTQEIEVPEGTSVVGREHDADVWIGHPSVSREHARLERAGDCVTIEDLGSKNGTWRGERRLTGRVALADGDQVRFGTVPLVYRAFPVVETSDATESVG